MRYDVAIVGAGPAGAWAAHQLARGGARVAVFDGSHPREKPCGGGVTERALRLVGDPRGGAIGAGVVVTQARFTRAARVGDDGPRVALSPGALTVFDRRRFDAWLLERAQEAGATFVPSRVTAIDRLDNAVRVMTSNNRVDATCVFGADGANSLVRRRLGRALPRADLSMTTGFYIEGGSSREIVLEMVDRPAGYLWSFPRHDHLAIGVCAQADAGCTVSDLRDIARRWIDRLGLASGATALRPYSWPVPSLAAASWRSHSVSGPGWLLLGDAAGLVDPITREGIYFALHSAALAAQAWLQSPTLADAAYARAIRHDVADDLAIASRYKRGFFRPAFTSLLLEALAVSPAVRSIMADLVAGVQPYGELKWRLARTAEWRLLWRWLSNRSARG